MFLDHELGLEAKAGEALQERERRIGIGQNQKEKPPIEVEPDWEVVIIKQKSRIVI